MRSPRIPPVSSGKPALWLAQATNAIGRVYALGASRFGLGKKPNSTELCIDLEKLNLAISLIPPERLESFLDRERPGETQQDRDYRLQRRVMREESEALKKIRESAGDDTEAAISGYEEYIREHPDNQFALISLGTTLREAGRLEESLAAHRQALQAKNGSAKSSGVVTHIAIGNVLKEMGRLEEAAAEYRILLDDEEASEVSRIFHARAYLHLGDVLRLQGKERKARAAWKQAVKQDQTGSIRAEVSKRLKE
jgi:tetratricopeptide (TPR) repeat protein